MPPRTTPQHNTPSTLSYTSTSSEKECKDLMWTSHTSLALTTQLTEEQVLSLARKAGLRALQCDRAGVFRLVEVWLDNTILVEVLTAQEAQRYQAFMNPQGCAQMFGEAYRPADVALAS